MAELPGSAPATVTGVTTYGELFVAVGEVGTTRPAPAAWWSTDGRSWTSALVEGTTDDGLSAVFAGRRGLVARGRGEFGKGSYWSSTDGRSWKESPANPAARAGGDPTFIVIADGNRLLGYGSSGIGPEGGPIEYWTSFDGDHWLPLEVSGNYSVTQNWATRPFLLRDGVLFSLGQSEPAPAWVGVPGD